MPVKPAEGETIEQTTRTRVVKDSSEPAAATRRPPFWDWIDTQSLSDWNTHEIDLTLFRSDGRNRGAWCAKYSQPPFNHAEIKKDFGGGGYNVMVKYDKQLIYNYFFEIAGAPKANDEIAAQPTTAAGSNSEMMQMFREMMGEIRAMRGGDAGNQAIQQAVALSGQVFSSATTQAAAAISRIGEPHGAPAPNPMEGLMGQFMQAMITKMMNPSDPIEQFSKMLTAMNGLGITGGKTAAPSMGTELMRMVPSILPEITKGMALMGQMREQELRALTLARGGAPPPAPQPNPQQAIVHQPPPQSNVTVMPSPQQQPEPQQTGPTMWDFIEGSLVNIINDQSLTVDEAANESLIVIIRAGASGFIDTILEVGEPGLLQLFQTRPILMQVAQNPRLTEFIKRFLELAKEARVPENGAQAPPA